MESTLSAIAGFVTAFFLWWIYCDNVSGSVFEQQQREGRGLRRSLLWLYIHLPLVISLAATGVGVEPVIEHAGHHELLSTAERGLLCGPIALCYFSLAVLHRMGMIFTCKTRTKHRLAVMLVIAIAATHLPPLTIMTVAALVGVIQVALDIYQGKPEDFV